MFKYTRVGLRIPAVLWLPGILLFSAGAIQAQNLTITPSGYPTVTIGGTMQFTAVANGFTISNIKWLVGSLQGGAAATGTITTGVTGGLYTAPPIIPGQNPQTIGAVATATNGAKYSASIYVTILPPAAVITSVSPNPLPSGTRTVTVTGSGFTANSMIWENGVQYPTQQTSATTLTATVYNGASPSAVSFTVVTAGTISNAIVVPVGNGPPPVSSLQVVNGSGSGNYAAGAVVAISANAAPAGQKFAYWAGATVANSTSAATTITMPAANTTVTATYAAIPPATYTLTVVNGTGGGTYTAGTVVSIAANTAPSGQQFQSWTGASVANSASAGTTITMPAGDTTVTANYAASPTYALTVINGINSGSYAAGAVVTISANAAPAGQVFSSWSGAVVTLATSATTTLTMPAANATVTANYSASQPVTFTVTYSGMGSTAGFVPTDPNQYSAGQIALVPGNTGYLFNPGHSFVGWNTAPDGSGASYPAGSTLTMGTSNVTLYPMWNTQDWPVSVWGGARNVIVLKADGTVWTWGLNSFGELGNGMTNDTSIPGQVLGQNGAGYLSGVTAVMGGEAHNLALKSDGTVWAWGMNMVNQLGNGNATNSATPLQVSGLSSVVSIASRGYHSLALKSDGTVWTWGEDRYGALGNGIADYNPDYPVPVQVPGVNHPLMLSSGYYYSVALMPDHTLLAWGDNSNGQLGDGTTSARYTPVPVLGIDHVVYVSAGWNHTVAIKSDGTVWTWGANNWTGIWPGNGMLGDGTTADRSFPKQVPGLAGAIQVSGGDSFTAVLLRDGTVWTFGSNAAGQLGTGSLNLAQSLVPVQVLGLSNVVSISARDHHAQALRSDGTVWSWGTGQNGELGNGTMQNSPTPVQVTGLGN